MLPFHVSRMMGTSAKVLGFALAKPEGLKLVFHDEGVEVDPDDVDVHATFIAWKNFRGLSVKHGIWESRVSIEVTSLDGLDDVPAVRDGKIVLDVPKRNREKIEPFERQVSDFQSGRRGNVDEEVDDLLEETRRMLQRRHEF